MNDTLTMLLSYVVGLGPPVLLAVLLGIAIPMVFAMGQPSRWLVALAVLYLCIAPLSASDASSSADGSIVRQLGWGSVFLYSAYLALVGKYPETPVWRLIPPTYALLLLFALISVIWSEIPWISFKRVVQLIGVPLIAIALVRHATSSNALTMFTWPGALFLGLGFLAMAAPSVAFDTDGNFRGLTYTKNVWAQFAMLMALVYLYQALHGSRSKIHWWLFAMATASLLATRSTTGLVIYLAAAFIISYGTLHARFGKRMVVTASLVVLAAVLGSFAFFVVEGQLPIEAVLKSGVEATGKNLTFTGRTDLWEAMFQEIARHPWLGAGYGGFWTGLNGPSATIVAAFSWGPGQAHSGYIEVTNELGVVGISLFVTMLILHLTNIVKVYRAHQPDLATFHLAMLVVALLLNFTESNFMRTTHLWWIALSTSIIAIHVQVQRIGKNDVPG